MARNDYWRKRELKQRSLNIQDEKKYAKELDKIYKDLEDKVNKEINDFYARYATKEGISMKEAMRRADKLDIEKYSAKAKKYVQSRNKSPIANAEMRIYNLTMKVNRLELLKANIGLHLIENATQEDDYISTILNQRAESELLRQAGILGTTIQDNGKLANSIVNASFKNATFSDRIWTNQDILKHDLNKILARGLIAGENPRKMAQRLKKTVDASTSNAERLMRTELARVQTDAAMESYKSLGVDSYEFMALGDACDICKAIDGRVFKMSEMDIGNNAPPMHPNCRCATAPVVNEKEYDEWLDHIDKGETTLNYLAYKSILKRGDF